MGSTKTVLTNLSVTLNAITMKKALFISLCALLLAGGIGPCHQPETQGLGVHSGSHPGHYFQDFQEVFFRDHTGGVVAPVAAVALEKAFQRGMMAHHFEL